MVMLLMPINAWERELGLYSIRMPRTEVVVLVPPWTVTSRALVAGFCVMVARKRAPEVGSSLIQPVAEGMLIAPPETVTVLPAMLGVPLRASPRTLEVLANKLAVVVP